MLFEPEQACLHEVRSENVKNRQTDRQTLFHVPVLYTAQWLLDNFPDVLLILKCLASKNYCVTIVLASNNM
jgi:hypothetical protein